MRSSRQAAILSGDQYYFTGQPCNRGHIAARRTDNYTCVECARVRKASLWARAREDPEKMALNRRRCMEYYREVHPARVRQSTKTIKETRGR